MGQITTKSNKYYDNHAENYRLQTTYSFSLFPSVLMEKLQNGGRYRWLARRPTHIIFAMSARGSSPFTPTMNLGNMSFQG